MYDGIPIAPHLYFTQFLDDTFTTDRMRGMKFGMELLKECSEIRVFADEISEGMIEEIKEARRLKIPIRFYNSDMEEIKYDALIINNRIGIGYKHIIEDTVNPGGGKHICPYAGNCEKSCTKAQEKEKPENSKTVATNTKGND
jgi:hypothetical protein